MAWSGKWGMQINIYYIGNVVACGEIKWHWSGRWRRWEQVGQCGIEGVESLGRKDCGGILQK